MVRIFVTLGSIGMMAAVALAIAQSQAQTPQVPTAAAAQKRPPNPKREPSGPGYVTAKELPDGAIPTADVDGNFIIGPTHNPAPEMAADDSVPKGTVYEFTMSSADSKFYPGIAKDENATGEMDPKDPTRRLVTAHPAPYTRHVAVYVPKQYVAGTAAPFMLGTDGVDRAAGSP